jgi:hypothetical protein
MGSKSIELGVYLVKGLVSRGLVLALNKVAINMGLQTLDELLCEAQADQGASGLNGAAMQRVHDLHDLLCKSYGRLSKGIQE